MPDLYITMAVPNPAGMDRTPANRVTNDQLNGEWLEFKNISLQIVSLTNVKLAHYTFDDHCKKTGEADLVTFGQGSLASGKGIRVHTGRGEGWWEGDIYHFYSGHGNFVWNNKCGDTAVFRNPAGTVIDWAYYDPNPGEGAVLRRIQNTNKLA